MRRFWIRAGFCIFFSLVLFFLGVEVSHLPNREDLVEAHGFAKEMTAAEATEEINPLKIGATHTVKEIRENQVDTKNIFSQAGIWIGDSVSNGLVCVLEKIFS